MQLKDMFVKPIDRDIQGVIIVGQGEETNVAQELIRRGFLEQLRRWASGSLVSLEAVNLTS